MRLTSNHLKVIRAQLANGQKWDRYLDGFDMEPCMNWTAFLFAPHGRDAVYLSMFNDETKRGATMEINRAFMNELNRAFDSAMGAAILIERGSKASAKAKMEAAE